MMAVNYALKRIRNFFFRKTTIATLRLDWLKISVTSALLSLLAPITRYLNRILMGYGAPQRHEIEVESALIEDDVHASHRSIRELKPDYTGTMDHAEEIHHDCPHCESNLWNVKVSFEDYEISTYIIQMECALCGTYALAPTLADKPYVS